MDRLLHNHMFSPRHNMMRIPVFSETEYNALPV